MPADACAVPFAVGECFHPAPQPERVERGSETQDPYSRGHMSGQSLSRIDDTLLIREAQRDGGPYPPPRSGNNRNLIFKSHTTLFLI